MTVSRDIVAMRWLVTAGTFEPPPKMTEAVLEYAVSYLAANLVESLEASQQHLQSRKLEGEAHRDEAEEAIRELEGAMTPTAPSRVLLSAYKGLHEVLKRYTPVMPLKASAFQKLTDESREKLYGVLRQAIEHVRQEVHQHLDHYDAILQENREHLAKYRSFAGGVVPLREGTSKTKSFPVDLEGWRYGSDRLLDIAVETLHGQGRDIAEQVEKGLERAKETGNASALEYLMELKESCVNMLTATRSDVLKRMRFDKINVSIEYVAGLLSSRDEPAAFWSPALKLVTIKVPKTSVSEFDRHVRFLRRSVAHELRHMGQTLLQSFLAGFGTTGKGPRPGLPGRHIMTPEFDQHDQNIRPMSDTALHSLDDNEFYTDLADAIEDAKDVLARFEQYKPLSRTDRLMVIKQFVGLPVHLRPSDSAVRTKVHHFFRDLARQAPRKYRKAVSELTKAVL